MKVAELEGESLDIWVANVVGDPGGLCSYSTEWEHGGPLIERLRICIGYREVPPHWGADFQDDVPYRWWGTNPLMAAMRAVVASKFGDEVPEVE
ncbi:phage protein NinX family protein [Ralstonia holmesii]|uniref:phage protein NinX family protein n=1 Tax=Ralstonia holmesii TaxID=3058602 RepID=UPI003D647EB5